MPAASLSAISSSSRSKSEPMGWRPQAFNLVRMVSWGSLQLLLRSASLLLIEAPASDQFLLRSKAPDLFWCLEFSIATVAEG